MSKKYGKIVVIEGIDRAGKDTLIYNLMAHLENNKYSVKIWQFPDYSLPSGKIIRKFLDREIYLNPTSLQTLYIANRYEKQQEILNYSKSYHFTLINRYALSSIAYGAAHGATQDFLWEAQMDLLVPDATIYIDISIEESMKRGEKEGNNDVYESDIEMMKAVYDNYNKILEHYNNIWKNSKLFKLDGTKNTTELGLTAYSLLKTL